MNSWVSTNCPAFSFWRVLYLHRLNSFNKWLVLKWIWCSLKSSSAVKEFLFFIRLWIFCSAASSNTCDCIQFIISYPISHVFYIHRFLNMQIPWRALIIWWVVSCIFHPLILEWEPWNLTFSALILSERRPSSLFVNHKLWIFVNWDICNLILHGLFCSLHIIRRSLHLDLVL